MPLSEKTLTSLIVIREGARSIDLNWRKGLHNEANRESMVI